MARSFILGFALLCIGAVSWSEMDSAGRKFWLILTPSAFIIPLAMSWFSRWRAIKRQQAIDREPEPTHRNPPAKLPPRRDQSQPPKD